MTFGVVAAVGTSAFALVLAYGPRSSPGYRPLNPTHGETTLPTGPTTTSTTGVAPQALPGVVADCIGAPPQNTAVSVKPFTIFLACGDGGILFENLSWTNWTTSSAAGAGQLSQNDCTPDCAQGTFHQYMASLTLTTVLASINGPVFSVAAVTYPDGGPGGKASDQFSLPVPPPPSPSCLASQLRVSLPPSGPGSGGNYEDRLVLLTNQSSQDCHLQGFPGLELVDGAGRTMADAERGCPWAPQIPCPTTAQYVDLSADGGSASFILVYQYVATPPTESCPDSATAVITPPNAFGHLTLPVQIPVCSPPPQIAVGVVQ